MSDLVLDCSVALSWLYGDGEVVYVSTVLDLLRRDWRAVVPTLWRHEIANGLVMAERRKRADAHAMERFVTMLGELDIICVGQGDPNLPVAGILPEVKHAISSGLTAYDNAYLVTAMQLKLPIATLDKDLRRAARAAGIADAVKGSPRT